MNTRYRVCFFTIFLLFNGFSYYSIFSQPLSIEELAREKVYNSYDEAFGDPWNCVVLDLSYQNLTFNSERVRNLNNLRVLHLAGNPNVDFEEAFTRKYFGSLPYLQIIDLQENNLKYLPSGLSKFPYLNMFLPVKIKLQKYPIIFADLNIFKYSHFIIIEFELCPNASVRSIVCKPSIYRAIHLCSSIRLFLF